MGDFIKVHGFNGEKSIVDLKSIAIVKPKESHSILTMKEVDNNGINIQITDAIRSFKTYEDLLVDGSN